MRYVVVEANSAEELQRSVQHYIDHGYEPQGGMAVVTSAAGMLWYYQAMVSRDPAAGEEGE